MKLRWRHKKIYEMGEESFRVLVVLFLSVDDNEEWKVAIAEGFYHGLFVLPNVLSAVSALTELR